MITNFVDVQGYPSLDNRPIKQCHILLQDPFIIICGNLDIKDLSSLSLVSREWHLFSSHDNIWKRFENEFKVQAPQIKSKIHHSMTSLDVVYDEIENTFNRGKVSYFYCRFIKILFENNVKIIKVSDDLHPTFTIHLRNTRRIYFNDPNFHNIIIPKIVCFNFFKAKSQISRITFLNNDDFDLPPVEVNNLFINFTHCSCSNIAMLSDRLIVSYDKRYIIFEDPGMIQTLPDSLVALLDPASVEDSGFEGAYFL